MPIDIIFKHEDCHNENIEAFLLPHWKAQGQGPSMPPLSNTNGSLSASVNQGRWIVECPSNCGNCIMASTRQPYYICTDCGGDTWFEIVFPDNGEEIEQALLKRPAKKPFHAIHRNWDVGESVELLEEQTKHLTQLEVI